MPAAASVLVNLTGTSTAATLYSDDGVTPQTNPIVSDSSGEYAFYAADGIYDLVISVTGFTTETKTAAVHLFDSSDAGRLTFASTFTTGGTKNDILSSKADSLTGTDQASIIRVDGTFTNTSTDDEGIIGFHSVLANTAGSGASSNMHAMIGTVRNSGPGDAKGIYARSVGMTGSTGVVVGLIAAVTPASGSVTSYGVQVVMNSSGTGGDGVGKTVSAGILIGSDSGTCALGNGFALNNDIAIAVGGAGLKMFAIGAGDFVNLKSSNGLTDLFITSSTGATKINNTSAGAVTTPLTLLNASGTASTGVALVLDPNTSGGSRVAQLVAYHAGANVISLDVKLSNAASPATVATFSAAGALTVVGAFGCNTKAAQTAFASGGALNAYGAGANGLDTGANMSSMHAMVVAMRAALVANGIMS